MAERRMFSKAVVETDLFYDMPSSAQALYFHLGMNADDEGFLPNSKAIMSACGSKKDDMKILIEKQYVIPFKTGIIVIRHWKESNYIQKDRFHPTKYIDERNQIIINGSSPYALLNKIPELPVSSSNISMDTECIQNGYSLDTEVRLGKDRLEKGYIFSPSGQRKNIPSSIDEVWEYAQILNSEKGFSMNYADCEAFIDHHSARGWILNNGKPVKDWQSAFRTWARNAQKWGHQASESGTKSYGGSLYDE